MKMYFPATILMQYIDVLSTEDLRKKANESALEIYKEFVKNTQNDVHSTILLMPNLRERFKEYRKALNGLILGKDVELFFSKDYPAVIDYDPSELEFYIDRLDEVLADVKLRKNRIIERIIVTDMLFRLYYDLHPKLKDLLKEYRALKEELKNLTFRKAERYASAEKSFIVFDRHDGANVVHIYYPEQLRGFIASCLPLMTLSGLVQMGMMHFFVSERYSEVNETTLEAKKRKGITEPTDEFLADCELHYEKAVDRYIALLETFISNAKAVLEEKDPIERFILSNLPCTLLQLLDKAHGVFSTDDVVAKVKDLVRRGIVRYENEILKS